LDGAQNKMVIFGDFRNPALPDGGRSLRSGFVGSAPENRASFVYNGPRLGNFSRISDNLIETGLPNRQVRYTLMIF
jgi:hypothetical protein